MSYEYTDHMNLACKHMKTAEAASVAGLYQDAHHALTLARQEITRALIQIDHLIPNEPEAA